MSKSLATKLGDKAATKSLFSAGVAYGFGVGGVEKEGTPIPPPPCSMAVSPDLVCILVPLVYIDPRPLRPAGPLAQLCCDVRA